MVNLVRFLAVSLLAVAAFGCGPTKTEPGALLVQQGTDYNFNVMNSGGKGSHVFTFRNTGRGPLALKVGNVSCSCTGMTIDGAQSATVAPGKVASVKVDWKVGLGAPEDWKQEATVLSDDPKAPETTLTVRGKTRPSVVSKPGWGTWFGTHKRTESRSVATVFYSPAKPDMRVLGFRSSSDNIVVTCAPSTAAERAKYKVPDDCAAYTLAVTVQANAFSGRYRETVLVSLDVPDAPELGHFVSGNAK